MITHVPYELLILILKYVGRDNRALCSVSETSKYLNKVMNFDNELWRYKCISEYARTLKIPNKSWRITYLINYRHTCVCCFNVSHSNDIFQGDNVCKVCQEAMYNYCKISESRALSEYNLKKADISLLPSKMIVSGKRKYTYYLKKDVINIANIKYTPEELSNFLYRKRERLFNIFIKKRLKLTLMVSFMFNFYNINIIRYSGVINTYSRGVYKRYINNIGKKQKLHLQDSLVKCYLELDFLESKGYNIELYTSSQFSYILLHGLLMSQHHSDDYGAYINDCIKTIKKNNLNKFIRKIKLIKYSVKQDVQISINDHVVIDYIFLNKGTVDTVITYYKIEEFFEKHISCTSMLQNILSGNKTHNIRKTIVRDLIENRISVPGFIKNIYL